MCLVRGGAGRRGGEGRCTGESGGRDAAEEGRRRRNNRSVPQTAAAGLTRKIWTKTPREPKEESMKGGRAHLKRNVFTRISEQTFFFIIIKI